MYTPPVAFSELRLTGREKQLKNIKKEVRSFGFCRQQLLTCLLEVRTAISFVGLGSASFRAQVNVVVYHCSDHLSSFLLC